MIRDYEEKDREKVIEFHERILRETGAFVPGSWNDDMKNIEEVYIRPGGCFVLIEENNSIFAEIQEVAGIAIDHSFLNYKKELAQYGYQVGKISLKDKTVIFNKIG